ncbi:MAG: phosphoribosylformylglycinamidine synthase I [Candidatus Omnitrophica bacterium]|nr:phosphoribosylformylglycinamidine synthase I [Candidatus Omnitrophota bacterium]
MSKQPKVIVLRTAGTNCDSETAFAFAHFGAQVDSVHIDALYRHETHLREYHILAVPGGFTYGDDIESGRILANELRHHLGADLGEFIAAGKLIIGICNGFQVLVKAGILPGPADAATLTAKKTSQTVSLTHNDSGKFEDRWSYLRVEGQSVWTRGLDELVYYPVAHAEGKFVADPELLQRLAGSHQIAFRYCSFEGNDPAYPENPNGSLGDVAGITDPSGRILGLMPHPERHFFTTQHPFWTRLPVNGRLGQGALIFENGVNYVREHFCQ